MKLFMNLRLSNNNHIVLCILVSKSSKIEKKIKNILEVTKKKI